MPDGLSDIIVADRLSDANQRRIPATSNLQVSWELSRAGMLSCEAPYRDIAAAGVTVGDLLGKWVHYTHPTAGPWGGQIVSASGGDTPGVITINAEGWASCLRGVYGDGNLTGGGNTVITHVRNIVTANTAQTGIVFGEITGASSGASLFDETWDFYESILPGVIEYIFNRTPPTLLPVGYTVDPLTRKLYVKTAIGTDRSAAVKLADRVTNVESSWSDDASDFTNYLVLTGKYDKRTGYSAVTGTKEVCDKWKKKKNGTKVCLKSHKEDVWGTKYRTDEIAGTVVALNQASINQYGRKGETIATEDWFVYDSLTDMKSQAQRLLASRVQNQQLVSITCTDVDGLWSTFREGDVVAVDLSNSGRVGKMAVRSRAIDVSRGIMIVAGEAELT